MLEEQLARVLPESLKVLTKQAVLHHFCLVVPDQKLHDLVCIAHAQGVRLLERMHEIVVESLARVPDQCVGHRVVFIVKCEAPWRLLAFAFEADGRVELDPDGQVPLEWSLVVLEPHGLVIVDEVRRGILVEQTFDVHQNVEQVVLTWCHDLHTSQRLLEFGGKHLHKDYVAFLKRFGHRLISQFSGQSCPPRAFAATPGLKATHPARSVPSDAQGSPGPSRLSTDFTLTILRLPPSGLH